MRPGEKMFEELVIGAELSCTRHAAILTASEGFETWDDFEPVLHRLEASIGQHDPAEVRRVLNTCLPGHGAGVGRT
jgi:FlaA1/EpsC-like NDP-sugar epimerase